MRGSHIAMLATVILVLLWNLLMPSILSFTVLFFGAFLALGGIRIVQQYEKGLVLTLGKFSGMVGPGVTYVVPILDRMMKVDTRIITIDVSKQEVMTKDNVPVMVDAVVFYKIVDAKKAILDVQDYHYALSRYAQTALRDVIGEVELDEVLSSRDKVAEEIMKIVDKEMNAWGIDVAGIKIQHIELPSDMKRAMARQAEAEREKRANIITSEGEVIASKNFAGAAKLLAESPGGLQLRTLQTIESVSPDQSNTIVFTIPLELTSALESMSDYLKAKKAKKG